MATALQEEDAFKNIPDRIESIRMNRETSVVQLIGAPGAGKSSFINSLLTIMSDDKDISLQDKYVPTAPSQHMGGHTLLRKPVELTETMTVIDNRGWHDWTNDTALKELIAQINGQRGYDDVIWEGDDAMPTEEAFSICDKATCLVVVINGRGGLESQLGFKRLVKTCNSGTGRRPLVVVTHRDVMSNDDIATIKSDLQNVHGISLDRIFFIHNEMSYSSMSDITKLQLVACLDACITDSKRARKFHARNSDFEAKRKRISIQEDIKRQNEKLDKAAGYEKEKQIYQKLEKMDIEHETFKEKMNAVVCIENENITQRANETEHQNALLKRESELRLKQLADIADAEMKLKNLELERAQHEIENQKTLAKQEEKMRDMEFSQKMEHKKVLYKLEERIKTDEYAQKRDTERKACEECAQKSSFAKTFRSIFK